MITKEFIDYISEKIGVERRDLIEKDLLLQQILKELLNRDYFNKNFVFKGGTCIIKCYIGYYRFSEDLDFSWMNQEIFSNKSEKQIRKILSNEINHVASILEAIAGTLSLDFTKNKKNNRYIEFGGSNKFVTFKVWYESKILQREQFVKIQVNFVEQFKYKFKICAVKTMAQNLNTKELNFLFPSEVKLLLGELKVSAYDPREMLIEKARAILTRRGLKSKDFVDVYFLTKSLGVDIKNYREKIMEKTVFMLKYEKYLANFLEKENVLKEFKWNDEENILLKQPGKDFEQFMQELKFLLNDVLQEIKRIRII